MDDFSVEGLYGILLAVALSVILTLYSRRRMGRTWQGVVEDVRSYRRDRSTGDDSTAQYEDYVRVRYRTDAGKRGKITFKRRQFDAALPGVKPGDRLIKEAGSYYPRKADTH